MRSEYNVDKEEEEQATRKARKSAGVQRLAAWPSRRSRPRQPNLNHVPIAATTVPPPPTLRPALPVPVSRSGAP